MEASEAVKDKSIWEDYFYSIRKVCPWSYSAWKRGLIDICLWKGIPQPLENYEARVNIIGVIKPRLLKKIEKRLNTERGCEEWLHSHPSFGVNATPVPVLIQQDEQHLAMARQQMAK